MAIELRVPSVGESITEVVVGQWLKKAGDSVAVDEPVVEIDTDKVSTEILAPHAGVITELRAKKGDTLKVGDVIALIGEPSEVRAGAAPAAPAAVAPAKAPPPPPPAAAPVVMPAAAREMATSGVPLSAVTPSGPGGRVLKEDVQRAAAPAAPAAAPAAPAAKAPPPPPPPPPPVPTGERPERAVKMTPLRKRIAQRLVESQQTAAILTTFNEVDMQPVMDLRKKFQDEFVARHGIKLGFMSLFVKATCEAIKLIPEVNASIRGDEVIYHDYCDIGVAVGGGKGLVVPVIRHADRLDLPGIEKTIADFGRRAKDNKITLDELQGGTFTISNGGVYGSLMSTPIINPPQSAILGMHAINDRPMAVNGQVVIRPVMYIALSYDHRLIDGREAVTFLKRIKECIEHPGLMLLGL